MAEGSENHKDEVLLKRSDLNRLESRLNEISKEIAALEKERHDVSAVLEHARVALNSIGRLTGSSDTYFRRVESRGASIAPPKTSRKASWTSEISRILREQGAPVTYPTLRAEIEKGPLADRLARSEKGLYGAVGKLEARGDLVKHKGWMFDAEIFRRFQREVAAGKRDDVEEVSTQRKSPMGERALEIVSKHPGGITSKRLVAELKRDPEFRDVITRNATSAYNVFARLVKRNEMRKVGRTYYPHNENDPPMGGSDTGEARTSLFEGQERPRKVRF